MNKKPILAIIGGSGLYDMPGLKNVETIELDTPFGKPSSPIITGELSGKPIAFLARHGIGHTISPTEINYRANIYAIKSLGIKRVVSVSACGSLREDYAPGHIIIPDQLVDFTRGPRKRSFFENGVVSHVGTAEPFCTDLSNQINEAAKVNGAITHLGGTYITIEGPRFSTKGESNLFRAWGMSIIGMTSSPEAFLAREAELCYATMAHVTDYDVWHVEIEPVTVEMVIQTLQKNTEIAQKSIATLVESIDENADCVCHHMLENTLITPKQAMPEETKKKLSIFIDKYL
jgi:5'-methylthioadenosine phosphorylase